MELNLWVLARRLVPLDVIKRKLDDYIAGGHIAAEEKDHYVEFFENMQGVHREPNLRAALEVMRVQQKQQTATKDIGK